MIRTEVTVSRPDGIHARVAAQAVLMAPRHPASVFLRSSRGTASLTKLADVLGLDINQGDVVEILADGPDEAEALHEVATFLTTAPDEGAD